MKKSIFVTCLVASLLALSSGVAPASNDEAEVSRHSNKQSIVGAWEVIVTLRVSAPDCTTAAVVGVGPNPFPSFNTFHKGGTMNEFGTRSPPSTRGSGHGVWRRVGWDTFEYRNLFHSFDANGLLFRTANTTADLKLADDGQTFTGISRLTFTDLSGNALKFCATLAGTRIAL